MVRLGVAPCNYSDTGDGPIPDITSTLDALLRAIRTQASHVPLLVDVFSLNAHYVHGDTALADDFYLRLQDIGIPTRRVSYAGMSPLVMAGEIALCDAFISARLHGAITAYMYGVPVTIIEYHRKCQDFAHDVGLPAVRRISADRCDVAAFTEALNSMLSSKVVPALDPVNYAKETEEMFRSAPWHVS